MVGLAFKEGTDDVRESPAVGLVENLIGKGFEVMIYDRDLSLSSLVGANRSFALATIPHLAELLVTELNDLVGNSDLVVINHQLNKDAWGGSFFRKEQIIIDLVGVTALAGHSGYEGIYW